MKFIHLNGISKILEEYKSHALGHATNLATNPVIVSGVKAKDHDQLFQDTETLMENGFLDYLVLTDEKGNVIIRSHVPGVIPNDNINYQENVSKALQGIPFVSIEEGRVVRLSIRGGAPIVDQDTGNIIGAISTGYVLSENTIVDMAKDIFNSEFTLYHNDERIASSLITEHNRRFVGGLLDDENIKRTVFQNGQMQMIEENLFGSTYLTGYIPLYKNSEEVIGVISTSVPFSLLSELKKTLLSISLVFSILVFSVAAVSAYIFVKKYNASEHERKMYEQDIHDREEHLRQITYAIGEGVYVVDKEGRLTFMNPVAERMLKWQKKELIGKNIHEAIHFQKEDGTFMPKSECKVLKTINSGETYRVENDNFIRKDGSSFPVSFVSAPLTSNGNIIGSVAVFQDMTERKRVQDQLRKQAHYDLLTNIPNRRLFEKLFIEATQQDSFAASSHALLFIDIDRFKLINDSYGHNFGDWLLQSFSQKIQDTIVEDYYIARFGGDEFIILLKNVPNKQYIEKVANCINEAMKHPLEVKGQKLVVTCSIGISIYPQDGTKLTDLLKKADLAINRAKQSGRNQFTIYSSDVDAENSERLALEGDLQRAFERDEFSLHYQPIVDPVENSIVSMEALLRWKHPQRGFIPPATFIPIAESNGLIIRLNEWVLYTACQQMKKWHDKGYSNLKVSVNISPIHFHHPHFVEMILRVLNETGLEPKYLNDHLLKQVDLDIKCRRLKS